MTFSIISASLKCVFSLKSAYFWQLPPLFLYQSSASHFCKKNCNWIKSILKVKKMDITLILNLAFLHLWIKHVTLNGRMHETIFTVLYSKICIMHYIYQFVMCNTQRFSLLINSPINFKTGSTLKCRLDFTVLTHL